LKYLLDTNVVSELRKGQRCNHNVAAWFARAPEDEVFLSVLTIGEIRTGIDRIQKRDGSKAGALNRWLKGLIDDFSDRILPIDRAIAEEWGRLNAVGSLRTIDGLLAATAKVHGMSLATRNVKDIVQSGVDCINPFA
jgi:predicted nucleic acid-binding protein